MIPLLRPSNSEIEEKAVLDVLRSGWWGNGPKCQEFESRIAQMHGYKEAITVSSATAALHLTLLSYGLGPGDKVVLPALTFVSSALAVSYCGATPVFCDVHPDTLCFDYDDAIARSDERVKAAVTVDYAGYPAASRCGIYPTIQDAAHSFGGMAYGHAVCFSFHPVKPLATGDGGAILTNDSGRAERLRALRWCGINASTWERAEKRYGWDYAIQEVGYKCHWNDIQAAIALAQLERMPYLKAARWRIAERYGEELGGLVEVPLPHPYHTWHLYPVRVAARDRNGLIDHLLGQGISAGVHYKPLTHYPMYSDQPTPPVTEREWQRLVSLPIYPDMTDSEQERVIDAVKGFVGGRSARGQTGAAQAVGGR